MIPSVREVVTKRVAIKVLLLHRTRALEFFPSEFSTKLGTADTRRRSTQMSECANRSVLRRIVNDRLYKFHRLLVAQFSSDAENFLERVRLSSMRCPACGGQMALSRTITTFDPRETEHIFACVRCGLSYLTEDHIPVNGRAVI